MSQESGPEQHEQQFKTGDNEVQFPLPEYVERAMNMKYLYQALEEVLEFYGTEKTINRVLDIISYEKLKEDDGKELNFRTWCGLVAFAERLALDDPSGTDSCDEVCKNTLNSIFNVYLFGCFLQLERADFNSMESRIQNFKVPSDLRQVFDIVRNAHKA